MKILVVVSAKQRRRDKKPHAFSKPIKFDFEERVNVAWMITVTKLHTISALEIAISIK